MSSDWLFPWSGRFILGKYTIELLGQCSDHSSQAILHIIFQKTEGVSEKTQNKAENTKVQLEAMYERGVARRHMKRRWKDLALLDLVVIVLNYLT